MSTTKPLIDITKCGDTRQERINAYNAFVQKTEGIFVHNLLNYMVGPIALKPNKKTISITLELPIDDFVGDRGILGFPMQGNYMPVLTLLDMNGVKD